MKLNTVKENVYSIIFFPKNKLKTKIRLMLRMPCPLPNTILLAKTQDTPNFIRSLNNTRHTVQRRNNRKCQHPDPKFISTHIQKISITKNKRIPSKMYESPSLAGYSWHPVLESDLTGGYYMLNDISLRRPHL